MSAPWGFGECVQFSEINHMAKNQCSHSQLSPAEGHCPYPVIRSHSLPQPPKLLFSQVFPISYLVQMPLLELFPADSGQHNSPQQKLGRRNTEAYFFFVGIAFFLARFLHESRPPTASPPLLDLAF